LGKIGKSEFRKEKCKKVTKFNKDSKEKLRIPRGQSKSFPNPVSEVV
jgi:hypothetical protein